MKTPEQHAAFAYIETARTPLSSPVKIDKILEERMQKFMRARLARSACRYTLLDREYTNGFEDTSG